MENNSEKKALESFSVKDRFDLIKSKIEHEDSLISSRINWLLAIQGILITTYVSKYADLALYLQLIIILFGLISALNISANICSGERSLSRIRAFFDENVTVHNYLHPKFIYGHNRSEEEKMLKEERVIIENEKYDFYKLYDYDKRLLLGDYSGSGFLRRIGQTWILPVLCIFCWLGLFGITIYTDFYHTDTGGDSKKTEITTSLDKTYSYTCANDKK